MVDTDRLKDALTEVYDSLCRVRSTLRSVRTPTDVAGVEREIDSIIELFERDILRAETTEPAMRTLDRLRPVDRAFDEATRRWSELRTAIGLAAAEEIVGRSNPFDGWQRRWGAHIRAAWDDRARQSELAGRSSASVSLAGRSRGGATDSVLVLDLRYGAGLPMAQIAEILGLSPAAVQMRLADFEARVMARVAREAIIRQVPDGWRLTESGVSDAVGRGQFALRRAAGRPGPHTIVLQLFPMWEERETASGRPRSSRWLSERFSGGAPRVWVIMGMDDPRILFLPESMAIAEGGYVGASPQRIVEMARQYGFEILGDAVTHVVAAAAAGD